MGWRPPPPATSLRAAYAAFTCGMLAWGWQEISFYMGFVTGPRAQPLPRAAAAGRASSTRCRPACGTSWRSWRRQSWWSGSTWGQPNQIGAWTFLVLWWMHQSARLNVFLGVRNLSEELLPEHLAFLKSYMSRKPMNLLFPVSVTVSTVVCALLAQAAAHATDRFAACGLTFLATLMALAILEHWFLMLPLPAAALWHWGLRGRADRAPRELDPAPDPGHDPNHATAACPAAAIA